MDQRRHRPLMDHSQQHRTVNRSNPTWYDICRRLLSNVERGKREFQYSPEFPPVEELWPQHIEKGAFFSRITEERPEVVGKTRGGEQLSDHIVRFEDADLPRQLLFNIKKSGYVAPVPIQQYGIPWIMKERDLVGLAATGTGKTAAFLIPIVASCIQYADEAGPTRDGLPQSPRSIILAPTRELVTQIYNEARKLTDMTDVKCAVAFGGMDYDFEAGLIKDGCDILVVTPARLLYLLSRRNTIIKFDNLKTLVLDEFDSLVGSNVDSWEKDYCVNSFSAQVRHLFKHPEMPERGSRQTLLFSATVPDENIQTLLDKYLLNDHMHLKVGQLNAANKEITQKIILRDSTKFDLVQLVDLINDEFGNGAEPANSRKVEAASGGVTYTKKVLVFVGKRERVKRVADYIQGQTGIPTVRMHRDLSQKNRTDDLEKFRTGECPILVATWVASRGLDIPDVDPVIILDRPFDIQDYIHCIGRTGRVGNPGRAFLFVDTRLDGQFARDLMQVFVDAQQDIPEGFEKFLDPVRSDPVEKTKRQYRVKYEE